MRRILAPAMCLALAVLGAGCSPGSSGSGCEIPSGEHTLVREQQSRTFRIAVPPGGASSATPMVVSLHPLTGDAALQEQASGFSELGATEGFIAVYPQGPAGEVGSFWDAAPGSADVKQVASLIEALHDSGCSTPQGTYVNGYSMGAMMTSRLVCEYPQLMSGAGMVAGVLPPEVGCRIADDIAVVIVHSPDDRTVPFDGSLDRDLADLAGGPAVADYPGVTREAMAQQWAVAKGCPDPRPSTVRLPGQTVTTWTGCGDAPTIVHVYDSSDHGWNARDPAVPPTSTTLWLEMRQPGN